MQRSIRGSIAEASALEGGRSAVVPAAASAAGTGAPAQVAGRIELSPELAARVAPGDTLFVFARAAAGPRLPLAILRRTAAMPADFRLDDSMAMAPQLRLSGFASVVVGARISRSGNATPQAGDLIGQSAAVATGTQGLRVVIDQVQR
jgi:cytochrome c-type biogenesis protein CcmH